MNEDKWVTLRDGRRIKLTSDYMNKAIRSSYIDKNTLIKTIKDDTYPELDKRHKYIVDRKTGITMGQLDYYVQDGKPTVEFIRVYEEYRRNGYGTKLMQHLQKEFKNTDINLENLTPDGKQFFGAIADITEKTKGNYDYHYKGKIRS